MGNPTGRHDWIENPTWLGTLAHPAAAAGLMVMSQAYFASEWSTLEHHTLLFRDPTNAQRRFIPVLIENCALPDVIAQFAYIDWRQKSEEAYARLLATCRAVENPTKDEELSWIGKAASSFSSGEIPLTNEEIALLLSAADSGELVIIDTHQTEKWVRAGTHDFLDQTDPAFAAIHVDALESLCNRRPPLVRYEGGILYMLTGTGFKIARSLNIPSAVTQ